MAAVVSRYARAFADVVASAGLDTAALDRQMSDFLATWDGSAELRALFSNPAVAAAEKVRILDKLNSRLGLQKELRNLIAVLIDNDRIGQVCEVIAVTFDDIVHIGWSLGQILVHVMYKLYTRAWCGGRVVFTFKANS